VCRYVERNPLRAGLVQRAEDWRWGSLWRRERGGADAGPELADCPVPMPRGWCGRVNAVQGPSEEEALRRCIARGAPFGQDGWVQDAGLGTTVRPRGRPKKNKGS
jgi:putative transposase